MECKYPLNYFTPLCNNKYFITHIIIFVTTAVKCGRYATAPKPAAITNGIKAKTKIPIYLNSFTKSHNNENKNYTESQNTYKKANSTSKTSTTTTTNSSASLQLRNKVMDKSASCSLMNATKSSSAKMVTKVVKEAVRNKPVLKNKTPSRRTQRRGESEPPSEIPVMERSGTFLKDEPTFGDKTTNIDLDQ